MLARGDYVFRKHKLQGVIIDSRMENQRVLFGSIDLLCSATGQKKTSLLGSTLTISGHKVNWHSCSPLMCLAKSTIEQMIFCKHLVQSFVS